MEHRRSRFKPRVARPQFIIMNDARRNGQLEKDWLNQEPLKILFIETKEKLLPPPNYCGERLSKISVATF